MFTVEDAVTQLPAPSTCCHATVAILDFTSGVVRQNKLSFFISHIWFGILPQQQKPKTLGSHVASPFMWTISVQTLMQQLAMHRSKLPALCGLTFFLAWSLSAHFTFSCKHSDAWTILKMWEVPGQEELKPMDEQSTVLSSNLKIPGLFSASSQWVFKEMIIKLPIACSSLLNWLFCSSWFSFSTPYPGFLESIAQTNYWS